MPQHSRRKRVTRRTTRGNSKATRKKGGAALTRQACQGIFASKTGHWNELPGANWKTKVQYNACKQAYGDLYKAFMASRQGAYVQADEILAKGPKVSTIDARVELDAHKYLDDKGWNEKNVAGIQKWKEARKREILSGKSGDTNNKAKTTRKDFTTTTAMKRLRVMSPKTVSSKSLRRPASVSSSVLTAKTKTPAKRRTPTKRTPTRSLRSILQPDK